MVRVCTYYMEWWSVMALPVRTGGLQSVSLSATRSPRHAVLRWYCVVKDHASDTRDAKSPKRSRAYQQFGRHHVGTSQVNH